jgi:MFS family permease
MAGRMNRSRKTLFFWIEGANSFATSFFFNYLLFHLRNDFGFDRKETLALGALHGLVYTLCAWRGGRLAQRFGYLATLSVGLGIMLLALALGGLVHALPFQILSLLLWTVGVSTTWPSLEALVCDGEDEKNLPRMIGIYNLVWAATAGLGYFTGGAIFDHLGTASLFCLPMGVLIVQLLGMIWIIHHPVPAHLPATPAPAPAVHHPEPAAFQQKVSPESFLKMAWFTNPLAYMAINTLLLIIPDLALRFHLSPTQSGIFCSVWFFTRMVAFAILWRWTGWHYRFRWLLLAYVALPTGFLLLLLAHQLWVVILAQVLFGAATGLIYYSSLFYSMDVGGDTQGEHGGLHEAAIGLGLCAGPALGAASQYLYPHAADISTWTVGALLILGLGGLIWLRLNHAKR